jgi:hypothetical protein
MVNIVDNIITRFMFKFDKTSMKGLTEADKALISATKSLDKLDQKVGKVKKMNGAMLGLGLSMLFTGMAAKRMGETILRSLTTAFITARDEGDFFVNQLLSIQASFEFLKFAIFDAFAQTDLFLNIVDFLVSMNQSLGEFISKNPQVAAMIVIFSGLAVVVGTVAMAFGQLSLLATGLGIKLGALVATLGFITVALAAIVFIVMSDLNPSLKIFLVFLAGVAIALKLIGVGAMTLFANPLILALAVVMGGFIALVHKLGGVGNAFKGLGLFIIQILAGVVDFIMDVVINAVNLVIAGIRLAIAAANKLGANIQQVQFIEKESRLTEKVQAAKQNFLAGIEQPQQSQDAGVTNIFNIDNTGGDDQKLMDMVSRTLQNISKDTLGSPNRG